MRIACPLCSFFPLVQKMDSMVLNDRERCDDMPMPGLLPLADESIVPENC